MLSMALFSLGMLPVYLALRYPFFGLPLHTDTGFYVSNHTVAARRIRFAEGWNAHFAGCSKVLPELFYSLVYLRHGGKGYKPYSRLYHSLYNYGTAILVGYTAFVLGDGSELLYYLGLALYCLLSSEPHYGGYFESAEQFELPFHMAAFLLLFLGIEQGNPYLTAAGFGIWALDGFFVKLSSLIGGGVLFVGIAVLYPGSLPHVVVAGATGLGLYLLWLKANRKTVQELLQPLLRHEAYVGHRLSLRDYARRIKGKVGLLFDVSSPLPVAFALAPLGAVIIGDWTILLYLAAVGAAYVFQGARVWYYTLPFLPPVAILAAFGVAWLSDQGAGGIVVACILAATWLAFHLAQSYGRLLREGMASLNRYVWRPYGPSMAEKNLSLERAVPQLRSHVGRSPLFIFGGWNQASVLLESSYDTPLISADRWLDDMLPNWQRFLNERFLSDPPEFLLDTDDRLAVRVVRDNLGLDYGLVGVFGTHFRLFKLNGPVPIQEVNLECKPFTFHVERQLALHDGPGADHAEDLLNAGRGRGTS